MDNGKHYDHRREFKKYRKYEIVIDDITFTRDSMFELYKPEKLAIFWAQLNAWETPKIQGLYRKLKREECTQLFRLLDGMLYKKEKMEAWGKFLRKANE